MKNSFLTLLVGGIIFMGGTFFKTGIVPLVLYFTGIIFFGVSLYFSIMQWFKKPEVSNEN